jgi:ABC-type dipeptide/oligopeptide/nickel transport system permease component
MTWLNLALVAFIASLSLVLLFSNRPRIWIRLRFAAILCFEIGGVLLLTLILVTLAYLATAPGMIEASNQTIAGIVLHATANTLLLVCVGSAWGTLTGLGAAFWFTLTRRKSSAAALIAALVWVVPTFLLAIGVQELQAQIYNITAVNVSGGYAQVSAGQVFWAAVVLGIRPGTYVFRQARVALVEESGQDFVRTARAKGLRWRDISFRHIFTPALPVLITAWLISFRLMIGSLPLVEFFFAYPGLGNLFLTSFGIGSQGINPDQAIAAVAIATALFFVLEAAANVFQQVIDPRLREARPGAEAVS